MTKIIKTAPVCKSDYANYLKKAAEFHEVMLESLSRGKWNAVGLNAIHAACQLVWNRISKARSV